MVTSMNQSMAVQTRRNQSGKRGYAKAVRRYMRRIEIGGDTKNWNRLPVCWPNNLEEDDAE